ncbi:MAG: DUF1573 domain-containing protein [Paludisphaera borealis]|uniref:DUF1573 domain-containing protein n=1 Tax=Paludisphaera borealis TaxID=1387353 RepID=UPI00283F8F13|nr:DUF1573 domain-containing protein [Paludisphaera borealis]MDR3620804.1 DUF1573 domain-containing protein [Paludisphaera borealis]
MRSRMFLIGSGVALIAVSGVVMVAGRRADRSPGVLKATKAVLEWQCPDPSAEHGSTHAHPKFEVVNAGGSPVRILSMSTSCGCATAEADPVLVPPGGRSTVTVRMDPLEVGVRAATITLETDAPLTPTVGLQVIAEGYRRPPYLFQMTNGLYFHEGYSRDEPREISIDVVALRSTPDTPPAVTNDLPFLEIGPPTSREVDHAKGPEFVVRTYRYPVRIVADPPDEGFSGQVSAAAPWIDGRSLQCNVHGEPNRPIRVVPSRLVLDVTKDGGTRFLARSNRGDRSLTASAKEADGPLVVEEVEEVGDSGFRAFNVRLKGGRTAAEGVYQVIVRAGGEGEESLTVPIRIRNNKEG